MLEARRLLLKGHSNRHGGKSVAATYVWFIRHGEVASPYVGTFVGSTDVPLSDVGQHQAAAIAGFLADAPLDAVLASPLKRARDTALPTARAHGLTPTLVDGLQEMNFGAWEGLAWDAIEARDPAFAKNWAADPMSIACPDGEAAGAFSKRVESTLHRLLQDHAGGHVAVFAHAGVNRAILSAVTKRPYMESFCFAQDYGCVNAAAFDGIAGPAQVALLNVVPGPKSAENGDGDRVA